MRIPLTTPLDDHLALYRLLVSDGLKSTDLTLEQLHRIAAHGAYAVRLGDSGCSRPRG